MSGYIPEVKDLIELDMGGLEDAGDRFVACFLTLSNKQFNEKTNLATVCPVYNRRKAEVYLSDSELEHLIGFDLEGERYFIAPTRVMTYAYNSYNCHLRGRMNDSDYKLARDKFGEMLF